MSTLGWEAGTAWAQFWALLESPGPSLSREGVGSCLPCSAGCAPLPSGGQAVGHCSEGETEAGNVERPDPAKPCRGRQGVVSYRYTHRGLRIHLGVNLAAQLRHSQLCHPGQDSCSLSLSFTPTTLQVDGWWERTCSGSSTVLLFLETAVTTLTCGCRRWWEGVSGGPERSKSFSVLVPLPLSASGFAPATNRNFPVCLAEYNFPP